MCANVRIWAVGVLDTCIGSRVSERDLSEMPIQQIPATGGQALGLSSTYRCTQEVAVRLCPRILGPQPYQGSERTPRKRNEEAGEESSLERATPIQRIPLGQGVKGTSPTLSLEGVFSWGVPLRELGNVHPEGRRETDCC